MWFKRIKYLFVFTLIAGLLCNCRKYRDDELISFETPFARLTAHPWTVVYFGVNYQSSLEYSMFNYYFII